VTVHVFVIGGEPHEFMTDVFRVFHGPGRFPIRATSATSWIEVVKDVVRRIGAVDVLDFLDHGNPGVQHLGLPEAGIRPVLFRSGPDLVRPLDGVDPRTFRDLLARHAVVRLVGCETGGTSNPRLAVTAGNEGRALTLKLAHRLGEQRHVLAMLIPTSRAHFDEGGLLGGPAREYMYSCHAALDAVPPLDRADLLEWLEHAGFPPRYPVNA
jgi:hypothetical protein